ncbi:carboxylesterase/lipase family protein [Pseudonocardia sp. GCM10023141]|uniref:carboxylesterase/lipase family protein n=1 Tax=Pseudonocardia sp. GCM10023141 TaxID=3252653 RepID=UPI0036071069
MDRNTLTAADPLVVTTTGGVVRGSLDRGVRRFLGIPYAAAPYGTARFAPPQPPPAWSEVRDADAYGPTPPQVPYSGGLEQVLPSVVIAGADVLTVNVWAPAAGAGHPVMVWLYGGALTRGSTAIPIYDGHAFARDGVVLVSLNYRLGAEGFSVLDDAPGNLGFADQAAALAWVRDNIAGFGGDPARVTLFGESAGGASVIALLAHPDTSGLFARAIAMSAPIGGTPRAEARKITVAMAADLGIAPTRAAFAAVSPDELLASQVRVTSKGNPLLGGPGFSGVIGDEPVPVDPGVALRAGAGARIPLLLGYTTEEYRLWFMPSGLWRTIKGWHLRAALLKSRLPGRIAGLYRRSRPGASPAEILGAIITDVVLRVPTNALADARRRHGGRTWMYEFAWRSPVLDLGAAHALEVGFVFDTLDTDAARAFAGPDAPQPVADAMHGAWVRFATEGDPGWAEWDDRRPVMTFDAPESALVLAPREAERRAVTRG